MSNKISFEAVPTIESDDGGCARIAYLNGSDAPFEVRLHTWSGTKDHPIIDAMAEKVVRVTIEVLG